VKKLSLWWPPSVVDSPGYHRNNLQDLLPSSPLQCAAGNGTPLWDGAKSCIDGLVFTSQTGLLSSAEGRTVTALAAEP
jgi:hypothetical protein